MQYLGLWQHQPADTEQQVSNSGFFNNYKQHSIAQSVLGSPEDEQALHFVIKRDPQQRLDDGLCCLK